MPDTTTDDGIGTLSVREYDEFIEVVADDVDELNGAPWTIATMGNYSGAPPENCTFEEEKKHNARLYAHRLVRCFEACRGVPDEALEPGSVARLWAARERANVEPVSA